MPRTLYITNATQAHLLDMNSIPFLRATAAIAGPSSASSSAVSSMHLTALRPARRQWHTWVQQPRSMQCSRHFHRATACAAENSDANTTPEAAAAAQTRSSAPSHGAQEAQATPSPAPNAWLEIQQSIANQRSILRGGSNSSSGAMEFGSLPGSEERRSGGLRQGLDRRTSGEDFEHYWQNRHIFGGSPSGSQSHISRSASGPAAGRMVSLDGRNVTVTRAMQMLNGIMARNRVRRELKLQERYEKPNQLRRRLSSERHRRRFANMVREKVKLVMELKQKGA